jgi:hypothetical protein
MKRAVPVPEIGFPVTRDSCKDGERDWRTIETMADADAGWSRVSGLGSRRAVSSKVGAHSRATARSTRARGSQSNTARSNVWDPAKGDAKMCQWFGAASGSHTHYSTTDWACHCMAGGEERAAQRS